MYSPIAKASSIGLFDAKHVIEGMVHEVEGVVHEISRACRNWQWNAVVVATTAILLLVWPFLHTFITFIGKLGRFFVFTAHMLFDFLWNAVAVTTTAILLSFWPFLHPFISFICKLARFTAFTTLMLFTFFLYCGVFLVGSLLSVVHDFISMSFRGHWV